MYYEVHGEGGTPLLLLHGGLFDFEQQFGALIPSLSDGRRVIATDFQGHGRTNDVDRPLGTKSLASDVIGLLRHLDVDKVDVFGFSVGGAVALELAINHPELVRKLIVSSVSFRPEGDRGGNAEAVAEMTVDMISGMPMEDRYLAVSRHPDRGHLQGLLDKLARYGADETVRSDDEIRGIAAPTLITFGDCDMVKLDHAVKFLQPARGRHER